MKTVTLGDPLSFSPENQMNASLVRPGGLHAIFIRSALSAMRVYEQTVTGLGLDPNYIHWCLERQTKEIKGCDKMDGVSVSGSSIIH